MKNTSLKIAPLLFTALLLAALCAMQPGGQHRASAQDSAPTPTYDPLAEPFLPENPTELELGQNLYWHWCMTCHGDRGQGLTDEWREVWEEDHQNCWASGCHAGRNGDLGFPIPTIVPSIINQGHLAGFDTFQALANFLKETHPPQHPGILNDNEYRAIAAYVFTQNDRPLETATPQPTITPSAAPTSNPTPALELPQTQNPPLVLYTMAGILLAAITAAILAFSKIRNNQE